MVSFDWFKDMRRIINSSFGFDAIVSRCNLDGDGDEMCCYLWETRRWILNSSVTERCVVVLYLGLSFMAVSCMFNVKTATFSHPPRMTSPAVYSLERILTRKHSSRMRTDRGSGLHSGGCTLDALPPERTWDQRYPEPPLPTPVNRQTSVKT